MIVDGVGSYRSDVMESVSSRAMTQRRSRASPRATTNSTGTTLECLKKVWMEPDRGFLSDEFYNMPGLGALYSRASTYIFGDWNKCGELMGLAPYGRPRPGQAIARDDSDGKLHVPHWTADFKQPYVFDASSNWEKQPVDAALGGSGLAHAGRHRKRAARARPLAARNHRRKNLCMAGGVALNCVANGRVAREAGFDNVWIQPAAGDDGIAIGCAYYGWLEILKQRRGFVMDHSYVGKPYSDKDVDDANCRNSWCGSRSTARRSENVCRDTAKLLADQQGDRLVSGPLGIRPACARQPQPAGRSAQARDEGHPQQPRQAPAGVPPVRADRAGRAHEGDF